MNTLKKDFRYPVVISNNPKKDWQSNDIQLEDIVNLKKENSDLIKIKKNLEECLSDIDCQFSQQISEINYYAKKQLLWLFPNNKESFIDWLMNKHGSNDSQDLKESEDTPFSISEDEERIIKSLHRAIVKMTIDNENLKDLFIRATEAKQNNNLLVLKAIYEELNTGGGEYSYLLQIDWDKLNEEYKNLSDVNTYLHKLIANINFFDVKIIDYYNKDNWIIDIQKLKWDIQAQIDKELNYYKNLSSSSKINPVVWNTGQEVMNIVNWNHLEIRRELKQWKQIFNNQELQLLSIDQKEQLLNKLLDQILPLIDKLSPYYRRLNNSSWIILRIFENESNHSKKVNILDDSICLREFLEKNNIKSIKDLASLCLITLWTDTMGNFIRYWEDLEKNRFMPKKEILEEERGLPYYIKMLNLIYEIMQKPVSVMDVSDNTWSYISILWNYEEYLDKDKKTVDIKCMFLNRLIRTLMLLKIPRICHYVKVKLPYIKTANNQIYSYYWEEDVKEGELVKQKISIWREDSEISWKIIFVDKNEKEDSFRDLLGSEDITIDGYLLLTWSKLPFKFIYSGASIGNNLKHISSGRFNEILIQIIINNQAIIIKKIKDDIIIEWIEEKLLPDLLSEIVNSLQVNSVQFSNQDEEESIYFIQ